MVVVPWHFALATSAIATAPLREIVWQVLLQGVLLGCCAFLAINYATRTIGSQSVGVLSALVPVIGAACSIVVTGEAISLPEWTAIAAISGGVAVASMPTRTGGIFASFSPSASSARWHARKIAASGCGMLRAESAIVPASIATRHLRCTASSNSRMTCDMG
jgi:hypothetical protein